MKKFLSALLALTCVAAMAVSVSAVGETYTAQKGTPVIDGTVDDVWANAEKVQLTHLKAGDLKSEGVIPEGLSVSASMLWDESAFYFLFDIHDDDFAFNSEAGDWKHDSVYLYIDELSTGGGTWQEGQSQNAIIPAKDLTLVPRKGTAPSEYQVAWSFPEENHCIIEFKYVPADIEPEELVEGFTFLGDFQYNDADDFLTRPYCLGWSDEDDSASNNADVWGVITLAGSGETTETEAETEAAAETEPETTAETEAETEAETVAETAAETEAAEEAAEETVTETTAPQTFDVTVIASAAAIVSLAGFAVTRKKS
ncbi:MAG: sugar-binding protein [Eubacteriales bacterium]|nr:sugar-binding protein [Eubacteriales bacterium]